MRRRTAAALLATWVGAGVARAEDPEAPGRALRPLEVAAPEQRGVAVELRGGVGRHGLLLGVGARVLHGLLAAGIAGELELFPAESFPDAEHPALDLVPLRAVGFVGVAADLGTTTWFAGPGGRPVVRLELGPELGVDRVLAHVVDRFRDEREWRTVPFAGGRAGVGWGSRKGALLLSAFVREELGGTRCVPFNGRCERISGTSGGVALTVLVDVRP